MAPKVALVTGASSGIGESTARELLERGYTVYGAARRLERMADLAERGVRAIALDVTDEESVEKAVAAIVAESGRIDLLVNNAGYGSYGAVEDVPLSEARYQFEVNVFGAARLIQLVLPVMRAQRSGIRTCGSRWRSIRTCSTTESARSRRHSIARLADDSHTTTDTTTRTKTGGLGELGRKADRRIS